MLRQRQTSRFRGFWFCGIEFFRIFLAGIRPSDLKIDTYVEIFQKS